MNSEDSSFCQVDFSEMNLEELEDVSLLHENVECATCGYSALTQGLLNEHILSSHAGAAYQSPKGNTKRQENLSARIQAVSRQRTKHKTRKKIDESLFFLCAHCSYKQRFKSKMKQHIESFHLKMKPHKCHLCSYSALNQSLLVRHLQSVHHKIKSFECDRCVYTASRREHLQEHIDAVHLGKRPFPCSQCSYQSARQSDLKKHVDAVHKGIPRVYRCPHCPFTASSWTLVRRHMSTHKDYSASFVSVLRKRKTARSEEGSP